MASFTVERSKLEERMADDLFKHKQKILEDRNIRIDDIIRKSQTQRYDQELQFRFKQLSSEQKLRTNFSEKIQFHSANILKWKEKLESLMDSIEIQRKEISYYEGKRDTNEDCIYKIKENITALKKIYGEKKHNLSVVMKRLRIESDLQIIDLSKKQQIKQFEEEAIKKQTQIIMW